LTLVLPATEAPVERLGSVVRDGTVAARVPDHPVALALLAEVARPLASSSANRAGEPAPTTAEGAAEALGAGLEILLQGHCPGGAPSTILDLTREEPLILREGAIPTERMLH